MDSSTDILSTFECPMTWNLQDAIRAKSLGLTIGALGAEGPGTLQVKEQLKRKLQEKLRCDMEYAKVDDSAAWQKCCQFLTLAWLHYSTDSVAEMRRILVEMDDFMSDVTSELNLLVGHQNGIKYLVNAVRAHLADKEGDKDELKNCLEFLKPNCLEFLKPFDRLEAKDRAAILSLKCCIVMEFGPTGHEKALEAINLALELEEGEAHWHFLKGKYMSQARRSCNHVSVPSDEELLHLRKAVSLKAGSAAHYVFCGQSVLEFGRYSRSSTEMRTAHLDECEQLMTMAALTNDNSPIILTRIAKALMNMDGRGSDLLDCCVHRSLELFPESGLVNHVAGNFFTRIKIDHSKAIFHLKKAALDYGVFGAFMDLLKLTWTCTETGVDAILRQFWEIFRNDAVNRTKALSVMAEFYFFVKGDVVRAIPFQREYMLSCSTKDQVPSPTLFSGIQDLSFAMVGDIRWRLEDLPNLNSDDEEVMRGFLRDMAEAQPTWSVAVKRSRAEMIRRGLAGMNPKVKGAVARKLQLKLDTPTTSHERHNWRAQQHQRKERELPVNWRS